MHILHINCNYIRSALHQNMIEELNLLGIENEVFVPTYDRNTSIVNVNSYVTISECFNKWDRIFFDYKQRKIIETIEKQYDIRKFDVIHAYTLFMDGNVAKVLSEKYGVPFVVAVRNTDVNNFFRTMIHLRHRGVSILEAAKQVFFLSESYKNQVFNQYIPAKKHSLIGDKVQIIPNGVDSFWIDNIFPEHQFNQGNIKLVYAGRIDANKNITTIQKAVTALVRAGITCSLTVVGSVDDKKEFAKISKDLNTSYIPKVSKEDLIRIYRSHDIFVMPSYTESFGLVYAEAMSQGLPVIYTKGQGFDGQFPDGTVGFSVTATDVNEIANKIRECSKNSNQFRINCIKGVKKFQWNIICQKYMSVYQKIIDK